MDSDTAIRARIRERYKFGLTRLRKGQPDPSKLKVSDFGNFGRVPSVGTTEANDWWFAEERYRDKFIDHFGGEIIP